MHRRRLLAGGLVFGCLVALATLVLTTPMTFAQEKVESVVHTTVADFNPGNMYRTAVARRETTDGEVQLMVLGIAGEWKTDTNTTGLPPLARHTAVEHNGHIIVVGGMGTDSYPKRQVYYTTIQPDNDSNLADWQTTTPLPQATYPNPVASGGGLYWHASVVLHDRLYVLGGSYDFPGSSAYDTVSFAAINADGSLGGWQTTASLPDRLRLLKAVVVNDWIYVIGGWDDNDDVSEFVYYAKPDSGSGEISGWNTATAPFDHGVTDPVDLGTFGHMVAVYDGRIYVIAGTHPLEGVTQKVFYATPDPATGDITAWIEDTSVLGVNVFGGSGFAYAGALYTTGGAEDMWSAPSAYVRTALLEPDGSIYVDPYDRSWRGTDDIDPARFYHAAVVADGGVFYVIGGHNGSAPIANINRGFAAGEGSEYAPTGKYTSAIIDFKKLSRLRELSWNTSMTDTSQMTVTVEYRRAPTPGNWKPWQGPFATVYPGPADDVTTTITLPEDEALYFQYRVSFSTDITEATPLLNAVEVKYEIIPFKVQLTKEAQPPSGSIVEPGDVISYTLTYSNPLDGITAKNAYVLDTLPEYLTYIPGSIFGEVPDDSNPGRLRWDLGTVSPGEEGTMGFAVTVSESLLYNPPTEDLYLDNQATFFAKEGSRKSNPVTHIVEAPLCEITISKDADPPSGQAVKPGEQIVYTIHYENTGEVPFSQAVLTDRIEPPSDFSFSANPAPDLGDYVWDLGPLGLGDEGQVEVTIQIDDILFPKDWAFTNQAFIQVDTPGCRLQESPVVTHPIEPTDPNQKYADFVISDIRAVPADLRPKLPVKFYVTLSNQGDLNADDAFWLELYIKDSPSDPPTGPADHDEGYCIDDCLGDNARADFVQNIAKLSAGVGFEVPFQSPAFVFPAEGQYVICAQADVYFDAPDFHPLWGAYPEASEKNNIRCETIQVGPGRVYLPLVNQYKP